MFDGLGQRTGIDTGTAQIVPFLSMTMPPSTALEPPAAPLLPCGAARESVRASCRQAPHGRRALPEAPGQAPPLRPASSETGSKEEERGAIGMVSPDFRPMRWPWSRFYRRSQSEPMT